MAEQRGPVEIRWAEDGDPDDVVAPWPNGSTAQIFVHIERMSDGEVWMAIYEKASDERVVMWFHADKKNVLRWTVSEPGS